MPDYNIGQQGTLKSTPKFTRINGDDYLPIIYRNMGNNHSYPFVWGRKYSFDSAGSTTVLSGVKFHGMAAADYCMVTVGGTQNTAPYITKDSTNNVITLTAAASGTVDIIVMVGYPTPDLVALACRDTSKPAQSLP
jgi:hypothetical protein